ncbi:Signaling protein YkoW [Diplonema papillatum]|nr:Signaling protein YkoW [Diplonema papillatum]
MNNQTMGPSTETESLEMTWDGKLVVVSYLLSVQACYTAFLILQLRFSRLSLVLGSLCLSVCGIWGMHFVGMAAMRMDARVSFDVAWTVVSAVVAFACTTGAFLVVDKKMPADSSQLFQDLSLASHIREFKRAPQGWLVLAAFLIAAGVCSMHYLGLHAVQTEATVTYNYGAITASCVVALLAAYAALCFAFVLPVTKRYTTPTALVAGVAVTGMHYCGMYGYTYHLPPAARVPHTSDVEGYVLYIVFACAGTSFSVLAYATYLYRSSLKRAAIRATVTADRIIRGNYSVLGDSDSEIEKEGTMRAIQDAYLRMGRQLQRLKLYLPQSLLAVYEQGEGLAADGAEVDTDTGTETDLRSSAVSKTSQRPSGSTSASAAAPAVDASPLDRGVALQKVTVLVVNTRKFHASFASSPAGIPRLQHEFLEVVGACVATYKGIIDSFQGDHAVCTFNAASPNPGHPGKSVMAAVAIAAKTAERSNLSVTMGISSGLCLVGVLGTSSMKRLNVVGATFTQAAVLERLCKQYSGVSCLVAGHCVEDMEHVVDLQCVDVLRLPGREHLSVLFSPGSVRKANRTEEWMYQLDSPEEGGIVKRIFFLYAKEEEDEARAVAAASRTTCLQPHHARMLHRPARHHASYSQGLFYSSCVLGEDPKEFHSKALGGMIV